MGKSGPAFLLLGWMKLDDRALRPDANNLTLVRLFLASSVIYAHSWGEVSGIDFDNLTPLLGAPLSHFGVDGFFSLSGFLVYRSIESKNGLGHFVVSRAARLLPGLIVMLGLVVLAGSFFTSDLLPDYFKGRETLLFIFGNLSFLKPSYTLTGIRCGDGSCNIAGSLWTIPWEVRCYLLLVLLKLANFISNRNLVWLVVVASAAFAVLADIPIIQHLVERHLGSGAAFYMDRADRLWTAFMIGIVAYKMYKKLVLSWALCALIFIFIIFLHRVAPAAERHFQAVAAFYFALCLGFLTARHRAFAAAWPDYSYGMYIYAFPVMVAVQGFFQFTSPYPLALMTLVITGALAAASWHLVERPALVWARGRRRPEPAPPVSAST